jgi:Uma2 family endonuclease
VVEVVSEQLRDERRDVIEKKNEYAAFGVPYDWLVNPRVHTFELLELGPDKRYTIALAASSGIHAITGCEGLSLDLDAMWAEADSLPDDEEASPVEAED